MLLNDYSCSVLVIEDNEGDKLLIGDYLEEMLSRPAVTYANSFRACKTILEDPSNTFDVLLLDLSLPDHFGEGLIRDMITLSRGVPIIVLTGYPDINFSLRSLSLGISDYLLKDEISPNSLYKSILYAIERKRYSTIVKESEKRYSDLFHLSPQPTWVYNPETLMCVQVNQAAMEKYGYTEEEFLRMNLLDLRPEEEHERVLEAVKRRRENPLKSYQGRFRHMTKNRQLLEVEIYSNPLFLNNQQLYLVVAIDVTEKMNFDNQMNRAVIQAQETERYEIGTELHDNVCQILATSQVQLHLLEEIVPDSLEAPYHQSLELISQALKEIRSLSHQLAPALFADSTISETFGMLLRTFNAHQHYHIIPSIADDLPLLTEAAHLNLYRILQEQLRNISHHSDATEIEISLSVQTTSLDFRIRDNGIGFDPKDVTYGIGFANIRRRVELFLGSFSIQSSPGAGCSLHISIPLVEIAVEQV